MQKYQEMTREELLEEKAMLVSVRKEEVQISKIDGTRKYLFSLDINLKLFHQYFLIPYKNFYYYILLCTHLHYISS